MSDLQRRSPGDVAFAELWQEDPTAGGGAVLRTVDGDVLPQPVQRWCQPAGADEASVLGACVPPVLDVGCGPGRHVVALIDQGKLAVGIDASAAAVARARTRGAVVLRRSVFGRVPRQGRWTTALLMDGNIGIGGDPVALLRRLAELVTDRGRVVVELGAPGTPTRRTLARLERDGRCGGWFPWALVSVDAIDRLADPAGFGPSRVWSAADRWFALLQRPEEEAGDGEMIEFSGS